MDRVKIELPVSFSFSTTITTRITDVNYGGHVGNDVYLSLFHEARVQFLQHHGFSELNIAGASLIMADSAIQYKHELNYGDELKISVAAANFDRIGFDIFYLMEVKTGEAWLTAAVAKTGMVCFDYATRKKIQIPASAIAKLTGNNAHS